MFIPFLAAAMVAAAFAQRAAMSPKDRYPYAGPISRVHRFPCRRHNRCRAFFAQRWVRTQEFIRINPVVAIGLGSDRLP